jgi:hypothetical protein
MPCQCGGKTIPTKKVSAKKVAPKKVQAKKSGAPKTPAKKRATRIATRKANAQPNPFAKGCKCT